MANSTAAAPRSRGREAARSRLRVALATSTSLTASPVERSLKIGQVHPISPMIAHEGAV